MNPLLTRTFILLIMALPLPANGDIWEQRFPSGTTPPALRDRNEVWTGSEMIVWGGGPDQTGGRYNPATDRWTALPLSGAPAARWQHSAVWTGGEMVVWGGSDGSSTSLNSGGRYNPATNRWTATLPSARRAPATHGCVDGPRDDDLGRIS